MSFNIGTALKTLAPTLATMLGGPLAGGAVSALEGALGLTPGAGEDAITSVLQNGTATAEQLAQVRAADQAHAEKLKQMDIDLDKLNADNESAQLVAEVDDRKSARAVNSGKEAVWWIAVAILATFAVIMAAVLYGCFEMIVGGIPIKDATVLAAIAGLVGSVVGYVAANAQTVVNFIFGGSLGSQQHPQALAEAVQTTINASVTKK